MKPHFRLKKLTDYPEWHKKPFLLNRAEMANPYAVLTDFFDRYDLSNIRVSLMQWLDDSIDGMECGAAAHFYTHEQVAKLAEAAWLILQQRRQAKAGEGFENPMEEAPGKEQDSDTENRRARFVKWVTFPASLKATPIAYMKRVFEVMDLNGLREVIDRWQKIALTATHGRYDEAAERADLLDYCEGLCRLVEAAFVLQRKMEWDTEGRVKRPLSESIKLDLLTEEETFALNEEEISEPRTVIAKFFEVFSAPYARKELWDMLGCVVEHRQEDLKRIDLFLAYECLHAVLEASWLIQIQPEEMIQTTEQDKS